MEIPFDILDHIFGFLITHPASLVACSDAHPVFSRMVEKYRYYHIIIRTESTHFSYSLEASYLTKLLSDNPRIAKYVRVLQIELSSHTFASRVPCLERIAPVLPMFPVLECLVVSTAYRGLTIMQWESMPQNFRKAVEDCLHLPTLHEVHLHLWGFPLCVIDGHANIDHFSLCGTPKIPEIADTTYPQLKSLSFEEFHHHHYDTLSTPWVIRHIAKLQSLKYDYSSDETILELLEICSDTLNHLDLNLEGSMDSKSFNPVATTYDYKMGYFLPNDVPISMNLFSLPHLQHLTIRAEIFFFRGNNAFDIHTLCISFLPAAIKILKTTSSLRQLTIEINANLTTGWRQHDHATIHDIDFSPLTALSESPASFDHIDLHFTFCWPTTYAEIISLLSKYGGLTELIEKGFWSFIRTKLRHSSTLVVKAL